MSGWWALVGGSSRTRRNSNRSSRRSAAQPTQRDLRRLAKVRAERADAEAAYARQLEQQRKDEEALAFALSPPTITPLENQLIAFAARQALSGGNASAAASPVVLRPGVGQEVQVAGTTVPSRAVFEARYRKYKQEKLGLDQQPPAVQANLAPSGDNGALASSSPPRSDFQTAAPVSAAVAGSAALSTVPESQGNPLHETVQAIGQGRIAQRVRIWPVPDPVAETLRALGYDVGAVNRHPDSARGATGTVVAWEQLQESAHPDNADGGHALVAASTSAES